MHGLFIEFCLVHIVIMHNIIQIQIQIHDQQCHMFIANINVHIQYKITIFKLKCYNDNDKCFIKHKCIQ